MQHLLAQLSADDLARLDPPILERRLGDLIRNYVHQRSAELADTVIRHLEALYLHPSLCQDPNRQCAYRLLARHWRCIAAQGGARPDPRWDTTVTA